MQSATALRSCDYWCKLLSPTLKLWLVGRSHRVWRCSPTFDMTFLELDLITDNQRRRSWGSNVLCRGAQLLNGPTRYLTRQRLPMACVKLFLAVFAVPLNVCSKSFSSLLIALGAMLAHNSNIWCLPSGVAGSSSSTWVEWDSSNGTAESAGVTGSQRSDLIDR